MTDMMDQYVTELDSIFNKYEEMDEAKIDTTELQTSLNECDEVLAQMKLEIHSITSKPRKDEMIKKMNDYQSLAAKYRKIVLVGDASKKSTNQTQTERSTDSLEKLKQARAQLKETETVAQDTITELDKQKETINRANKNTKEITHDLNYGNKLLTKMGKWWRG